MVDQHDRNGDEEFVDEKESLPEDLEIDAVDEESLSKDKIKELRDKLTACEEEKRQHHEDLQRVRADFLNSKRRLEEQLARDRERATDSLLLELLALADSFDTAMADTEAWNAIDKKWRDGVEAIHGNLMSILKRTNITQIDPIGETFNPEEHEAVSNVTVDNESRINTVVTVLQKGYKRNGMVLRPARVAVGVKEA